MYDKPEVFIIKMLQKLWGVVTLNRWTTRGYPIRYSRGKSRWTMYSRGKSMIIDRSENQKNIERNGEKRVNAGKILLLRKGSLWMRSLN